MEGPTLAHSAILIPITQAILFPETRTFTLDFNASGTLLSIRKSEIFFSDEWLRNLEGLNRCHVYLYKRLQLQYKK